MRGAAPVCVAFVAGCVSTVEPSIPEAPTLEEYVDLSAELGCAFAERCRDERGPLSLTADGCISARRDYSPLRHLLAEGRVRYDAAIAADCLRDFVGSCDLGPDETAVVCEPFVGLVSDGAPCVTSFECTPGSHCTDGTPTCSADGVCARIPGPGEACTGRCTWPLACLGGTCTAITELSGLGEACDVGCRDALECVDGTCIDPSTVTWPALGEPCGGDFRDRCADGFHCHDGMCGAPHPAGEPCSGPMTVECGTEAFCDGTPMTCRPRAGPGEACTNYLGCALDLGCVAGVCVARAVLGAPCRGAAGCWSQNCESGICSLTVPRGECN